MRTVLVFLSFVAFALCTYHADAVLHTETVTLLQPNQIYYTPSSALFSLPNIENPISVEVSFAAGDATSEANICLVPNQATFPVPGNNLVNACPPNGFATASNTTNTTSQSTKLKFTRTLRDSVRGQLLSKMVEDTNPEAVSIYGQSSNNAAGFAVTTTSTTNATFTITLIGSYCDAPEFAVNGSCVSAKTALVGTVNTDTVPAGTWLFYTFDAPAFDPTVTNQVTVDYTPAGNVYIQGGYLPTSTWNIGTAEGASSQVINTPGVTTGTTSWYVGFDNSAGTADLDITLNITLSGCAAQLVGVGCAVNTTTSNSTLDGTYVIELDASLDGNNDGSAISLDLSDDENALAYFQLVNLPTFPEGFPYYVRVSVGNNNLEDDEDNFAPTLYAKLDGYPSAQSNDYAVGGSVANQVFLQVNSVDDKWYLAVPTPADFSIWVGTNCAGNCSDNAHGQCLCSAADGTTVACSAIANSTNLYPLYSSLPVSTGESAGACSCDDDDYAESFDCSQKSSPTVLFIVLIVIGGLIILFVAIGVPLYCYISNKRKERYERI